MNYAKNWRRVVGKLVFGAAVYGLCLLAASANAGNDYCYNRADYGQKLEGGAGDVAVWCCEAMWKVAQQRPVPEAVTSAASLSAARNDFEAVQVVVRPKNALKQLTAAMSDLTGPEGSVISTDDVQVLQVYYHFVKTPTDKTGVSDWWPDALPPLDKPLDVDAEKNQPLWVLVHVRENAKPGDYVGALNLRAEGWSAVVPVKLHVWNFALPERNHVETAFGINIADMAKYQHLKSEADQRRVWQMYMQNFADHRISPYNPVPFDMYQVKFEFNGSESKATIDFTAFDKAMTEAIEKYHFTNFRLPIQGMSRGKVGHGDVKPAKLDKFTEETPEYQAAFASQVRQLESHLREKGWLKMAYIYWFDEPKKEDFPAVCAGMDRIKKYAPALQTMITNENLGEDRGGMIDIWCPVSPRYAHEVAAKRQERGERYWWYVCTGPKAPYCTLFIDHPAAELRTWLWQTWQNDISGILVWRATYWTSPGLKSMQNPYEDPMGYRKNIDSPKGAYWGNGDGRFIYPPLAAASFNDSGKNPILSPPVSSIRWEMLREGIEDYEFLWLLRDLLDKKRPMLNAEQVKNYEALLQVPADITQGMTRFATEAGPIYARRAAIAEAIEHLSRQ
jgi:hypothetical protein